MISREHEPTEYLPAIDSFVDENGDVRPIDDDPGGFAAVGYTPYGTDHSRDEAVNDPLSLPEHLTDGDVDLQELFDAAKAFARASQLLGLIKARRRGHQPVFSVIRERENKFAQGTIKYKMAMGYRALKEVAIADGVDAEQFDHNFTLRRNEFYRLNQGETGEVVRKNLKQAVEKTQNGPSEAL